jgi:hypothetical protein
MTVLEDPPHISDVQRGPELEALAKVGAFLADEGLTSLLSVNVRHRHFHVAPDEASLEETNEEERTQTIKVSSVETSHF